MRSAARNICGYLSGLSCPSVTDMITTLARSPRSNIAGQTRLPTFSIMSIELGLGSRTLRPRPTMSASRWQPAPVLIWTTRHPVARIRSASSRVSWSPSTTAMGNSGERSVIVRSSSVVLPAPGELIRLMARIRCSANQDRLAWASRSFFARTACSSTSVRALRSSWTWTWTSSWSWSWSWRWSGSVTTTSSLEHPHVVHISGLQLHFLDGQFLAAQDLEVGAPARAQRDHVPEFHLGAAAPATGAAGDVDDLQLRSLQGRALGAQVEVEVDGLGDHAGEPADGEGHPLHLAIADLLCDRADDALGDRQLVHRPRLLRPPGACGSPHEPNFGGRAPRFIDHVTPPRRPSSTSSGPRSRYRSRRIACTSVPMLRAMQGSRYAQGAQLATLGLG